MDPVRFSKAQYTILYMTVRSKLEDLIRDQRRHNEILENTWQEQLKKMEDKPDECEYEFIRKVINEQMYKKYHIAQHRHHLEGILDILKQQDM